MIEEHLVKSFIVPNHAPVLSPILFAEEMNGNLRVCVDYKKYNTFTKKNEYFIPLINEVLNRIRRIRYFTCLDIIAAFNKIKMREENEDFTTFITF